MTKRGSMCITELYSKKERIILANLVQEQKSRESKRAALLLRDHSVKPLYGGGFSEQPSLFASSNNPLQTRSIENFGRTLTARDPPSGERSTLEPISER